MIKSTLLKSLLCSVALFFSLQAKLQIITTVAGNGNGGTYYARIEARKNISTLKFVKE
jgi:hypothetical protein